MEIQKLKLINVDEVERVWRSIRRQRKKTQENLIWDNFCKEQDIVTNIYQDDPYQFVEKLPADYHIDVKERKLENIKESSEDKDTNQDNESQQKVIIGGHPSVTFEDDTDDDEQMISDDILDTKSHDETDNQELQTVQEECKSEEQSPCTVRENSVIGIARETEMLPVITSPRSDAKKETKKPTIRTNVAESSMCCAKVKELRNKINTILEIIVESLYAQDLMNTYPEDYVKVQKRANEFCTRFSRVYLYQLQRQLHAIKRNNSVKLPFAKHTQFQSQMVRIVSLHQNILQSLQLYHKSFEQTLCAGDCIEQLQSLLQLLRDSSAECADVVAPTDIVAADLYNDSVLSTCETVESALSQHSAKAAHMKHEADSITMPRMRITCSKSKTSKHPLAQSAKTIQIKRSNSKTGSNSKSGSNSACGAEPRLSMYSLDAPKTNLQTKSRSDKDSRFSTKQIKRSNAVQSLVPRCGRFRNLTNVTKVGKQLIKPQEAPPPPRSNRKSPKCLRRPHMRDSQNDRAKNRQPRDTEIRTMVESVEATASGVFNTPQTSKNATPRIFKTKLDTPNLQEASPVTTKPQTTTPRTPKSRLVSPGAAKLRSPGAKLAKTTNDSINEVLDEDALQSSIQKVVDQAVNSMQTAQNTTEHVTPASARRNMCSKASQGGKDLSRPQRKLCSGDAAGNKTERVSGVRNAQLVCVSGRSPRQPSFPLQPIRIPVEKSAKRTPVGADRFRLQLESDDRLLEGWTQHRARFLQYMLASHLYTNSSVNQPWQLVNNISEQIIDEALLQCAREMQLDDMLVHLYQTETR